MGRGGSVHRGGKGCRRRRGIKNAGWAKFNKLSRTPKAASCTMYILWICARVYMLPVVYIIYVYRSRSTGFRRNSNRTAPGREDVATRWRSGGGGTGERDELACIMRVCVCVQ